MQPIARIRLLGQFDLRIGGEVLPPLDSARAESLLAHLLLHREAAQSRQRLAFLLWPDSTEAQARTNLRHVLHTLRRRLPGADRYLEITPRTLRWRPEPPYWLDVAAFEQLLATDGANRRNALRAAVETYAGDLLEGCYDEWLIAERDRLRHRLLDALAELAGLCERAGEVTEAISHAERLLRGDPLREDTYRQLIRLHGARGDRARALRVYHACSSTLERELGVEPAEATQAAYRALLHREPAVRPPAVAGPPLVGRAPERSRLAAAWRSADGGQARFVVVSGEPGVGKSRLVEEFRAWCARRGVTTSAARCYPAEGALAYGPVVAWLRSEALRPRLLRLDRARLTELARLLPELLVELPGLERPWPLPESEQRHRLFDAVSAAVLAAGGPLLLVVDDLQHGDRETCQLLHYLLRVQPRARVLVVATARREEVDGDHPLHHLLAGLHARERLGEIELARLGRDETAVLAERVTGAPLPESDARLLHDETEGNPLFVVEALRAGWTPGRSLSPRVHSVIEARLAQLSEPAMELVGAAATIGHEFSTDVLAEATGMDSDVVVKASTSCGGAGSSGSRVATSTTSATTGSARSPTSASAPPGAAGCTCGSPPRWSGRTPTAGTDRRASRAGRGREGGDHLVPACGGGGPATACERPGRPPAGPGAGAAPVAAGVLGKGRGGAGGADGTAGAAGVGAGVRVGCHLRVPATGRRAGAGARRRPGAALAGLTGAERPDRGRLPGGHAVRGAAPGSGGTRR